MTVALADLAHFKTQYSLSDANYNLIADVNEDGKVTNADLQSLLDLLKNGGGSTDSVPEPSTFVLAILAFGLLVRKNYSINSPRHFSPYVVQQAE